MKSKLVVSLVCFSISGCSWAQNQAWGSVAVEGTKVGTWTQMLNGAEGGCKSGTPEGFVGADLFLKGITVRVVRDPLRGPVVQLIQPTSDLRVELARESCSTLDLVVNRADPSQGTTVIGRVTFMCEPKNGGSVRGKVSFDCN